MTRIQIRRDTSSNWSTYNPVLADGEFALETDTRKLKIGNGEQPYNDLAYQEEETYTLPVATADTLGGIKVGDNLSITEDGVLNATGSAPTNMVTTNTDQNINATKVFYGVSPIKIHNGNYQFTPASIFINSLYGNKILLGDCPDEGQSTSGIPVVLYTAGEHQGVYRGINDLGEFKTYPLLDTGNFSTLAPTGNLKYWTGTETDYTAIATKDADTLYRTTDTNKVYLGTIQLGG